MEHIEAKITRLNEEVKSASNQQHDFRTFADTLVFNSDLSAYHEIRAKTYSYIPDKTRIEINAILNKSDVDMAIGDAIKKLLVRDILYLGAECEMFGNIDIQNEFALLKKKLSSKLLSLKKVSPGTVNNFIDDWDKIKPEIVFISCHGNEYSLYIKKDDDSDCQAYNYTELADLFQKRGIYTKCVVLSACESLNLGKAIVDYCDHVVCMNIKVDVGSATKYLQYFFQYINDHSMDNSSIYEEAHKAALEKITLGALPTSFAFEFIKSNKIT